jgi:hypothetical protein
VSEADGFRVRPMTAEDEREVIRRYKEGRPRFFEPPVPDPSPRERAEVEPGSPEWWHQRQQEPVASVHPAPTHQGRQCERKDDVPSL